MHEIMIALAFIAMVVVPAIFALTEPLEEEGICDEEFARESAISSAKDIRLSA